MRLLLFNLATDMDDPILGFTTQWIQALAEKAEFIHIITMRMGRIDVPENVRVYSVGKEKGHSEPRRAMEFYRHLFRILRNDQIDVCFSHMIPIFTILAAPVLKAKGIPVITWYAHPSLTTILKLAHHFSSRIVTSLPTAYPYKPDKLTVIGQGIDTELFTLDGTGPSNPPIILCVGRLSPIKNHPTLFKAITLLREERKKRFEVVILGSPASDKDQSYIDSLKDLVRNRGLQEIVHFKKAVSMSQLPRWYRQSTVHVNLTPTGFGDKVAWEAMACGRPCLVANEGFKETLGEYADRLLFRYGDAEDLARKLIAILDLPFSEYEQVGIYLRNQVIQLHSLDRLTYRLFELFKSIVQKQKGSETRLEKLAAN